MYRLLAVILLIGLMGCSGQKGAGFARNQVPEQSLNLSSPEKSDDQILFLTLKMTMLDSLSDSYQFEMINTIFAKGVLNKNDFLKELPIEPFQLYCELTDEKKNRIDLFKVQNPLLKVYEYSPDKQTLEKKLIKSQEGDLFLRFQLTKAVKRIAIYKPQADLKKLKLIYHAKI